MILTAQSHPNTQSFNSPLLPSHKPHLLICLLSKRGKFSLSFALLPARFVIVDQDRSMIVILFLFDKKFILSSYCHTLIVLAFCGSICFNFLMETWGQIVAIFGYLILVCYQVFFCKSASWIVNTVLDGW